MGQTMRTIPIDISPGELMDRITILEIKAERLSDPKQLENVRFELALLVRAREQAIPDAAAIRTPSEELRRVNETLWEIEDDIRACERAKEFGPRFVELARAVYFNNDRRSALKRQINLALGSAIIEEKSYAAY